MLTKILLKKGVTEISSFKTLPAELQRICRNCAPTTFYEVAIKSNYVEPQAQATFLYDSLFAALKACTTFLQKTSTNEKCTITDDELKTLADFLSDPEGDVCGRFWFQGTDVERKSYGKTKTYILVRSRIHITLHFTEPMRELGFDQFKIELIKEIKCNSEDELLDEEYKEINKYPKENSTT